MLTRPTLLYDGQCRFCRCWVTRLARWDRRGRIALVASQERGGVAGLPPISDEALDRAMHLVEPSGRVTCGGYSVGPLLGYLPGGWLLRWLFLLPGVSALSHAIYRQVARRRHRFGCGEPGCSFHGEV